MKSGLTNRVTAFLCAVASVLAAFGESGSSGAWRVVPPGRDASLTVPLPPLARVVSASSDRQMWRQTGELGGSVVSARGDFMMALSAGGWALNKTIVLGREPERSELMVWTLRKRRILFMVWEKEVGTCSFAWGEEK
jgi:hypothetical protein